MPNNTNEGNTDTNQDDIGYPKPGYAWYIVVLLLIIYTFSIIDRQILGLLGPEVKQSFAITDTEFGLLTGYAFALFYTIFGLFFARIADSKSRKWLIAFGLFLWSIMTALTAFSRTLIQLMLFRVGVGVGEATLAPAANSLIADSFPKDKLSLPLSVYAMGIPIGSGLAFIIGGHAIEFADNLPEISFLGFIIMENWQKVFLIVGIPGILLTILIASIFEPIRKGVQNKKVEKNAFREVYSQYKKSPKAYNAIMIGISLTLAVLYGTIVFLAIFLERKYGLGGATIGKTFGTISLITGVFSLLLGGWLTDKLCQKGRKDAHILTMLIAAVGCIIPALWFPLTNDLTMMWIMLGLTNFFLNMPLGVAYAGVQVITPNHLRGQMSAILILMANLLGYGLGPFLVGMFTDQIFMDEMAIDKSIALLVVLVLPIAIMFFLKGRKEFMVASGES